MSEHIVIIGAGGHARVVADILSAQGRHAIGHIDPNTTLPGVIGTDDTLGTLMRDRGVGGFVIGIGSVRGGQSLRSTLFARACAFGLQPVTLVHPAATVSSSARLGAGTVVMAGAIVNPGVVVGENSIVNTGAIIDHDGRVGAHTHIAPGSTLSGDVTIGDHCLVGTGTIARNGVTVGDGATVGAGSLLLGHYPGGATYVGQPARPLHRATAQTVTPPVNMAQGSPTPTSQTKTLSADLSRGTAPRAGVSLSDIARARTGES